jgi:hypothetical protein
LPEGAGDGAAPAIVFIAQPDAYRVADVEPSRLDAEARAKAQASP